MILLNIKYQNKPKGTKYGLMIHMFGGKTVRKHKEFWLVVTLVGVGVVYEPGGSGGSCRSVVFLETLEGARAGYTFA